MKLEITKNGSLEIVKGWTFKPIIRFTDDELLAIGKVYFICNALSICQEMIKDGNDFSILISPEITNTFNKMVTTYNLEIEFNETPVPLSGFNGGILEVKEK